MYIAYECKVSNCYLLKMEKNFDCKKKCPYFCMSSASFLILLLITDLYLKGLYLNGSFNYYIIITHFSSFESRVRKCSGCNQL